MIGTITCNGNTGSAQAITEAHTMLSALPVAQVTGAVNAIVFFTDGQPNGLTANWPINTALYQKSVTGMPPRPSRLHPTPIALAIPEAAWEPL